MTILICIFLYVAVAGAAIFGLLVAAYRFTDLDNTLPWILCGVFWPVTSLPAIGYLAAAWYINRKEIGDESEEKSFTDEDKKILRARKMDWRFWTPLNLLNNTMIIKHMVTGEIKVVDRCFPN